MAESVGQYSAPPAKEKKTKTVAALRLIVAIRDLAESQGPEALAEFEEYWINSPEWNHVWSQILQAYERRRISESPRMEGASLVEELIG